MRLAECKLGYWNPSLSADCPTHQNKIFYGWKCLLQTANWYLSGILATTYVHLTQGGIWWRDITWNAQSHNLAAQIPTNGSKILEPPGLGHSLMMLSILSFRGWRGPPCLQHRYGSRASSHHPTQREVVWQLFVIVHHIYLPVPPTLLSCAQSRGGVFLLFRKEKWRTWCSHICNA